MSSTFWKNYSRGPRELSEEEKADLRTLKDRIALLERESGVDVRLELFGKKIVNSVGVASGPAPNFKWLAFFAELGYGILTYKTMRDRAWPGHGMPNLLNVEGNFRRGFVATDRVTGSITNSLGMPTPEPAVWKQEARRLSKLNGERFFVMSVTATPDEREEEVEAQKGMFLQFASLALEGKRAGADAVELNLSCPNVLPGEGGEVYTNSRLCGGIVDAVRGSVGSGYPIFLKVGYLDDYRAIVDETYDDRIAYVAINSVPGVVRDASGNLLFSDRGGKAGICGAAIREKANRAVTKLAKLRKTGKKDFRIIGLGGVLGAWDAVTLEEKGADAIECATGALLEPGLALRISLGMMKAKARSPGTRP
jgi:dihydroorotate dehydrogenase